MSGLGQLDQAQRIAFVTNIPTILASGDRFNLAGGQLAILQKDGSKLNTLYAATNAPTYDKTAKYKIVQGANKKFNEALSRAQIPTVQPETVEFTAKEIIGWRGVKAKHTTKEDKIAVGYDGVDLTKSIKAKVGQTIVFYVKLTGTPVDMLTRHRGGLNREYIIDPKCLDESVCLDPYSQEACGYIQDELLRLIREDKFNNIPITSLISVSKITSCDPAIAPLSGLVRYADYCVEQCDNGDGVALGIVQSQYPASTVSVKSRVGSISTYTLQVAEAVALGSLPAALSNAGLTAFPNCATCPSNYTYTASANTYEIKIPYAASLPTVTGVISNQLISSGITGKVYRLYVSLATSQATTLAEINAGINEGSFLSISRDICTITSATTTAWVACGVCNKAPREFNLTLGDTLCGANRLAELQAAYPSLTISIKTTGTCVHIYETTVLSNCFTTGCSEDEIFWEAPSTFENSPWTEVVPEVVAGDCSCGVIIEGNRFNQPVDDCTLDYFDWDARLEGSVHIDITSHNHDYNSNICNDTETPVTYLQVSDSSLNSGRAVQVIESETMNYFYKMRDINPAIRKIFGYNYEAKADTFYDEYQLTVSPQVTKGSSFGTENSNIIYRFFFPEGKGKQFELAINSIVAGIDNLPIVVL